MKRKLLSMILITMAVIGGLVACGVNKGSSKESSGWESVDEVYVSTEEMDGEAEETEGVDYSYSEVSGYNHCGKVKELTYFELDNVEFNGKTFEHFEVFQSENDKTDLCRKEDVDTYNFYNLLGEHDDSDSYFVALEDTVSKKNEAEFVDRKKSVDTITEDGGHVEKYLHILLESENEEISLSDFEKIDKLITLKESEENCEHGHLDMKGLDEEYLLQYWESDEEIESRKMDVDYDYYKNAEVDMNYKGVYELTPSEYSDYELCDYCEADRIEKEGKGYIGSSEADSTNKFTCLKESESMKINGKEFRNVIVELSEFFHNSDNEILYEYEDENVIVEIARYNDTTLEGQIYDKTQSFKNNVSGKEVIKHPRVSITGEEYVPITVEDLVTALSAYKFEQAEKDGIEHGHVSPVLN